MSCNPFASGMIVVVVAIHDDDDEFSVRLELEAWSINDGIIGGYSTSDENERIKVFKKT